MLDIACNNSVVKIRRRIGYYIIRKKRKKKSRAGKQANKREGNRDNATLFTVENAMDSALKTAATVVVTAYNSNNNSNNNSKQQQQQQQQHTNNNKQ
jgi:hypothetical protein